MFQGKSFIVFNESCGPLVSDQTKPYGMKISSGIQLCFRRPPHWSSHNASVIADNFAGIIVGIIWRASCRDPNPPGLGPYKGVTKRPLP